MFVIPRSTSDECVRKNAKCHRQNRLPIIVWRHPNTKVVFFLSFLANEAAINHHHHHHSNHNTFGFFKQILESKWFENVNLIFEFKTLDLD